VAELLAVRNLSKVYAGRKVVLHDVSFAVEKGTTLGLVGPSGSGKTTLARCLAGFETPSSGEILFEGQPLPYGRGSGRYRADIQLIFQQPGESLNPRFSAREIIEEPLVIARRPREEAAARVMGLVGLPAASVSKGAHEFSGGERQRLAIARALVTEPRLLILDESFAGLDPALQEQISELVRALQQQLSLACIVIAHDLELVQSMARDLVVMEDGAIVEYGRTVDVLAHPQHRLTRELIEASRVLDAAVRSR
jgi:ABC-type dipeptide/oligopeptide/nickel transport system ATPase subunit